MEDNREHNTTIKRIAFIGNYTLRQSDIATFTADLCEVVAAECTGIT
jgi:hypothetical protein